MSWVATAVVGSAVVGGVVSNKASKRAQQAQQEAQQINTAATGQARRDVLRLTDEARDTRQGAFKDALTLISGAPEKQIAPFQAGNMQAQEQISRGLPQIQNALLGKPVDLSGFKPRSVGSPSSFNTDVSQFVTPQAEEAEPVTDLAGILQMLTPEQQQVLFTSLSGFRGF